MLEKLRNHYSLTLWLTRLVFCVSYIFGNWYNIKSSCFYYSVMLSQPIFTQLWLCLVVGLLSSIIWLLLISVICNFLIKMLNLYSFPKSEFNVVLTFFFAAYYLLLGILNLFVLITPVILVYAQAIFPVVSLITVSMLFYFTVNKLYLNNATAPRFFKIVMIFVIIVAGFSIISAFMGGY